MNNFDLRPRIYDSSLKKPRNAETHQNIKDIASNSIANSHVTMTLPDYSNPWECGRNTHSCSYERETHHSIRDAKSEPYHSDHPDHDVGVEADPEDTAQEGEDKPANKERFFIYSVNN